LVAEPFGEPTGGFRTSPLLAVRLVTEPPETEIVKPELSAAVSVNDVEELPQVPV
jgi:hypothetical protein